MQVTLGSRTVSAQGLGVEDFFPDVRLTRDDGSMDLSVLVYESSKALEEDWELTPGAAPVLKADGPLPDMVSAWWNENVVVAVHGRSGDIGADALDAFLAVTP